MKKIPYWAKWKAIDSNGDFICFESKPYMATDESCWLNDERWRAYGHTKLSKNWKEHLERIQKSMTHPVG